MIVFQYSDLIDEIPEVGANIEVAFLDHSENEMSQIADKAAEENDSINANESVLGSFESEIPQTDEAAEEIEFANFSKSFDTATKAESYFSDDSVDTVIITGNQVHQSSNDILSQDAVAGYGLFTIL